MSESDVNKIILLGRVIREPDFKITKTGARRGRFLLVTNETWWDRECNLKRQKTVAHMVVVYGEHLLRVVEKCVHRGARVYCEGQLDIRRWKPKDGSIESWTVETVIQGWSGRITVLDFAGYEPASHDLDEVDEPPTFLSIKRSAAKYGDGTDTNTIDAGLSWLAQPKEQSQ